MGKFLRKIFFFLISNSRIRKVPFFWELWSTFWSYSELMMVELTENTDVDVGKIFKWANQELMFEMFSRSCTVLWVTETEFKQKPEQTLVGIDALRLNPLSGRQTTPLNSPHRARHLGCWRFSEMKSVPVPTTKAYWPRHAPVPRSWSKRHWSVTPSTRTLPTLMSFVMSLAGWRVEVE